MTALTGCALVPAVVSPNAAAPRVSRNVGGDGGQHRLAQRRGCRSRGSARRCLARPPPARSNWNAVILSGAAGGRCDLSVIALSRGQNTRRDARVNRRRWLSDPLAEWVTAAHASGIELHAWFNPYRARHASARSPLAANHLANTHPGVVKGTAICSDGPGEADAAARNTGGGG